MKKLEVLPHILAALAEHHIVVCNGMIGREVFSLQDRPKHFYMIGSMGVASAIALGIAHCAPDARIAVIEGDGNTLMGFGNLAQIAAEAPKHFVHLCLDNGTHASTGGQHTLSSRVPIEKVALAAGYRSAVRVDDQDALKNGLAEIATSVGPIFLRVMVEPGTVPGIARIDIEPEAITARFQKSLAGRRLS